MPSFREMVFLVFSFFISPQFSPFSPCFASTGGWRLVSTYDVSGAELFFEIAEQATAEKLTAHRAYSSCSGERQDERIRIVDFAVGDGFIHPLRV